MSWTWLFSHLSQNHTLWWFFFGGGGRHQVCVIINLCTTAELCHREHRLCQCSHFIACSRTRVCVRLIIEATTSFFAVAPCSFALLFQQKNNTFRPCQACDRPYLVTTQLLAAEQSWWSLRSIWGGIGFGFLCAAHMRRVWVTKTWNLGSAGNHWKK